MTIIEEKIKELKAIEAPYGKKIVFQEVVYENGTSILRMRIREGNRFTIIDLDNNSASQIAEVTSNWSAGESE
ncbi:MAG: hypothetical protein GY829_00225 [Gammaproteobacteria bacterium]|nr:hypothetical protein [Gammaproteobacteria bacterium]